MVQIGDTVRIVRGSMTGEEFAVRGVAANGDIHGTVKEGDASRRVAMPKSRYEGIDTGTLYTGPVLNTATGKIYDSIAEGQAEAREGDVILIHDGD